MKLFSIVVAALFVLLSCSATRAGGIDLYVFNQHFDGKLWSTQSVLYAEAQPFLKLTGVTMDRISTDSVTVRLDQKVVTIPAVSRNRHAFIPVRKAAALLGLRFQYNAQTQTVDVFKPQAPVSGHPQGAQPAEENDSTPPGYRVDITKTEVEDGIDEMAVLVTVQNKGKFLPGLIVTCAFSDQDNPTEQEHVFDTQRQQIQNFPTGGTATVTFTEPYPSKSLTGGYRDYNKNIQYKLSLSYVVPPPSQGNR